MNIHTAVKRFAALLPAVFLIACATSVPTGPTVAVMPAQGKPFEIFQQDNAICKDYASREAGVDRNAVTQNEMLQGGVAGAVLGAAAGAAIGDSSRAAATGAGIGAIVGTAAGSGNAQRVNSEMQRRYDVAYEQCMYAKGNQLPQASSDSYYTEVTTVRTVPPYAAPLPPPPNMPRVSPPPPPHY